MANESVSKSRLIPISYYDPSKETRLSAYADTVVYERDGYFRILRAIRFGGYPEMVHALADAIYAGATIRRRANGGRELPAQSGGQTLRAAGHA